MIYTQSSNYSTYIVTLSPNYIHAMFVTNLLNSLLTLMSSCRDNFSTIMGCLMTCSLVLATLSCRSVIWELTF